MLLLTEGSLHHPQSHASYRKCTTVRALGSTRLPSGIVGAIRAYTSNLRSDMSFRGAAFCRTLSTISCLSFRRRLGVDARDLAGFRDSVFKDFGWCKCGGYGLPRLRVWN